MVIHETKGEKAFNVFNNIFMLLMIVVMLYPFIYVVMCSLSDSNNLVGARGIMLKTKGFSLDSYAMVLKNPNILTGYGNTLILVIGGTVLNLFMTSLGAFVLTRREVPIIRPFSLMVIFTMYFSGGLIPTYLLVYKFLGLGDTLWAVILPTAISTYNLIIMRTNFASIPKSLEESALIDGANECVVLFKIVLPLSLPIIATMTVFYGVAQWNSWFNAMIYLRTREKYPLQLILREILLMNDAQGMIAADAGTDRFNIGEGIKYATIVIATLPILCVYPYMQKYFVKGMMIGAVKG